MKENKEYQQITGEVYGHIQGASDEELLSDEVRDKLPQDVILSKGFREKKYSEIRSLEMIKRLKNSIEKLNKTTSRYSKILIFLTILIATLTLVMIFK